MVGAGLLAQKACERGLTVPEWVKTSLAPGSRVVTDYLERAGLLPPLEKLGFHLVGYGCTTCIGNSGPLPEKVAREIDAGDLVVCSVLSGNRNFEGRVHGAVQMNYLASPPLVVAYALAGRMDIDLHSDPLGRDKAGSPVFLRDIWPDQKEIAAVISASIGSDIFEERYASVFDGDERWAALSLPEGKRFAWDRSSTYVKEPPFFLDMHAEPPRPEPIRGARALALLGDSITTDHISPAGAITEETPAGRYLIEQGVSAADFNSYGSRRGNHEIMMRGTFANVRLRNGLAPGTEGGWTTYLPTGETTSIYDAAMRYADDGSPLIILAGKEYGSGSSRDWAAKGSKLLGIRAVIARSYERIHRSNLIGMGVLPLEFEEGHHAGSLGLTGSEVFDIAGVDDLDASTVEVVATPAKGGAPIVFPVVVRIDTPQERLYFEHGGILQFVLRQMMEKSRD